MTRNEDEQQEGMRSHEEPEPNQAPVDGPTAGAHGEEAAGNLGSSSQDRPRGTKASPETEEK